jgi:hypothetical protein
MGSPPLTQPDVVMQVSFVVVKDESQLTYSSLGEIKRVTADLLR